MHVLREKRDSTSYIKVLLGCENKTGYNKTSATKSISSKCHQRFATNIVRIGRQRKPLNGFWPIRILVPPPFEELHEGCSMLLFAKRSSYRAVVSSKIKDR